MNTNVSPAELKLINGDSIVTIRPRDAHAGDPIMCKEWDLGAPEVRRSSTNVAGGDGTVAGPGYLGSRSVTMTLQILGGYSRDDGKLHDAYWYAEQLTAMCHPLAAPQLQITRDGGSYAGRPFLLALQAEPFSMTFGRMAAAMLELTLTFTAPLGVLESPLYSLTSPPAGLTYGGWKFPLSLPDGFGSGPFTNPEVVVALGGTAPISPVIYISGPATNPQLSTSDGDRFVFSGLTLKSGETVQIDMGAGTILLGDADTGLVSADISRYQQVDFALSTFWRWAPGIHRVRYEAGSGVMTVQWRERQLTI